MSRSSKGHEPNPGAAKERGRARSAVAASARDPELLLRRSLGNRGALRAAAPPVVQRQCRDCEEEEAAKAAHAPHVQRKCDACEEEVQRAGLTISRPGDTYEQEADQVAEHVVQRLALPSAPTAMAGGAPDLQRECDECKLDPPTEEELAEDAEGAAAETVSRKAEPGATPRASSGGFRGDLERSRGGGRPLPPSVLGEMGQGFGQDFSHVRIHTGGRSAALSRSIHAKAFTYRNDIFFNQGRFDPDSSDGRRLLAHELTHVVQQTGGRSAPEIQRASELKIGNWAHAKIEGRLRGEDKKLVTEAPIPGGTRHGKRHNSVGFADLYKAEKQTMSGISAQEPAESRDLPEASAFFKYVNMRSDYRNRADSRSSVGFGPRIRNHKRNLWDFTPNFPSHFHVAEIKPLFWFDFPASSASLGAGISQEGNYREGFEEFVSRTYTDNPAHQGSLPAAISGHTLSFGDQKIPAAIDYKRFEAERLRLGSGAIRKRDTRQRVWIYELGNGVIFYFLLPHPYSSRDFPTLVEGQLGQLDPLLAGLRERRPRMDPVVGTKRLESGPARPAASVAIRRRRPNGAIQPKGQKKNWKKAQEVWETKRRAWVDAKGTGVPKPKKFLKEEAKGVEKKADADKKLGLEPTGALAKQAKDVRKIRFWSRFRGRLLGGLRFRFGKVFDKVEGTFENIREKFRKHRKKSGNLNSKRGIFSGWKKVATAAIIRFGVEIFKEMLVAAFKGFIGCINGIVEAVLGRFRAAVDEAKEDVAKEVEPVCCEIMSFKAELEKEFKKHEETISSFTETVQTLKQWREILDYVETAVRAGVQIVSCGAPPGLGCIWGLVAQLGISAGLSLLARTDYFEDEIAKPAARQLMDAIVGDKLHNFLIDVLERTPLAPFVAEAAACARRTSGMGRTSIGGNLHKLDPNDPVIAKHREEWESEWASQILADLQKVFKKGKGKKVTKEELLQLVELMQKSGKSFEEIKRMLQAALDPASGRLDLEGAKAILETGEIPEVTPKERDLDYEKAVSNNELFEGSLGWEPHQFVKRPGIKADSDEFAEAVYDMQEALNIHPDGMVGPKTVVAFYKKNRLEKDAVYRAAAREIARKKKKEEERRRAAEEAARPEPTFTVLEGPDVAIVDTGKSQHTPKGVGVYVRSPDFSELVSDSPTAAICTLDVYVDGELEFRIRNVGVWWARRREIMTTPDNTPVVVVGFRPGVQLTIGDDELILREDMWRTD